MIAGSALTNEPAISTGMLVVRPADSAARPTVIVRSLRVLQEQQPDQQVVPDLDELQHGHRGDGRPGQRQRDARNVRS